MNVRQLEVALYGLALLLAAGALIYPPLVGNGRDETAIELAQSGLQRIADGERALFATEGKYMGFAATSADRRMVLPNVDLGPEFDAFNFDAVVDRNHDLQLRVVSRVDAVAAGHMPPLLKTLKLTGHL